MALTTAQEEILEEIIEAYENGKRLSDLDEVGSDNPFNLYCEVLDEDGESKKAALASLLPYVESEVAYGVQRSTTSSSPTLTRIGNTELHQTLPIQSKMKGCLLNDDGSVKEYLDPSDWTGNILDGTRGQVMVEIPAHYRRFVTSDDVRQIWLSEYPVPGYHLVPKMYVSAYEATVDRTNSMLASVKNTATQYRGGNNDSAKDDQENTLLGMPATLLTRTQFRTYARNRGAAGKNDCGWNEYLYEAHKTLYWLFVVEYATLNSQKAYNAELDSNGYKQGGLGDGVSTLNGTYWNYFDSYYPFIPCGTTDELGNGTGVVEFTMPFMYNICANYGAAYGSAVAYYAGEWDSATAYTSGQYVTLDDALYVCIADTSAGTEVTDTDYFTEITRTTVSVPRYRGIENPFGHIWKWTDGVNVMITPTTGDNISYVYTCDDPAQFSDSGYDGYSHVGNEARTDGYVKDIIFGETGEIIPESVGGGSTTYFCDYHWTNIPTTTTLRGVLVGAPAHDAAHDGFVAVSSSRAPSYSYANIGSRLCFLPA